MDRRTIIPWFTTRRMTASLKKKQKKKKKRRERKKVKENSSTLSLSMYVCTFSLVDRVHFDPLVKLKWLACSKVTPRGVPRHFYGGPCWPACPSSSFLFFVFRNGARKWEHLSYLCGGVDDKVSVRDGTPPFYFARVVRVSAHLNARKAASFAEQSSEASVSGKKFSASLLGFDYASSISWRSTIVE